MTKLFKNNVGFTLIELLITVAIVAIISAVALPSYQQYVKKSRRVDAQGALMAFANAMERYYTQNNTYLGAASGGANTGSPAIFASESPLDGSTKYYNLTINAATAVTYTLRASPKAAQSGDGYLELLHSGLKRWDKNNDNDTSDAGESCWQGC